MNLSMTARERADLIELFGIASLNGRSVHLARADDALLNSAYAVPLRQLLIAVAGPLLTNRGQTRYRSMMKKQRVREARTDLAQRISAVPELAGELGLLNALIDESSAQAPEHSATGTRVWSTYSAGLKAAAEWFNARRRGWKFSERELAVLALGGSKNWTPPSKRAFSNVINTPFEEAVYTTDTGIRMLGPASWYLNSLVADASAATPFIELPGKAAATNGTLDVTATGVLLVENQETFQALSRTSVPEDWLCIWMEGYASDALANLLRQLPDIPLAAWGDLDPPGIDIIHNLSNKSGRTIQPVAMDPVLYAAGPKLVEAPKDLEGWRTHAELQITTTLPTLRPLACAIAANNGYRCEQEGLHERVLPFLHDWLRGIEII
ncbi:Wadjet anti-phage system protein JetD domain-containing protein [Streptomyces sp. NPDC059875]|uniref:Wadjet anti-phage system protein JetD domain-containing protein n=1 Tax=unclassified Streptomyces TaxID=2593676 RepID=UPI0036491A46